MTIYSDLKMFHFPEKLDSLPVCKTATAPLHFRIKPTNACNHRCRYCAYLDPNMQLGKDMRVADSIPQDKMVEICQDIVAIGVKAVTYSGGGEPLIYPHFLQASRILHEGGVSLAGLTNGSRLQNDIAYFLAHCATWIRVSMDGWDDASYTRYRGVADGEYTKIMRNMENFVALGGPCALGVSYIVDAENYAQLPKVLQRYKDIGLSSVKVSACITSNDAALANNSHASYFAQVKEDIVRMQAELNDSTFTIHDAFHDLHDRFDKEYSWCPYMQIQSVIGADMRIYTCHDKAYNLDTGVLGSLAEQSLRQFWFKDKNVFHKTNPSKDCNHHCVANAKNKMLLEFLETKNGHEVFV